jgi:hypothetical protein
VHIEDLISVVGDIARSQNRPSADGGELSDYQSARHGNDFDRQRVGAQGEDQFRGIDDADEDPGACRDDLLAGQGTAAALDELAGRVGLIRAIDMEGAVGIVTRGYRGRPRARLWSLLGSLFINE